MHSWGIYRYVIPPGPGQFTWSRRYHGCWSQFWVLCFKEVRRSTNILHVYYLWTNMVDWLVVPNYCVLRVITWDDDCKWRHILWLSKETPKGRSHSEPTSLWSEGTPFREILENFQYMLKAQKKNAFGSDTQNGQNDKQVMSFQGQSL